MSIYSIYLIILDKFKFFIYFLIYLIYLLYRLDPVQIFIACLIVFFFWAHCPERLLNFETHHASWLESPGLWGAAASLSRSAKLLSILFFFRLGYQRGGSWRGEGGDRRGDEGEVTASGSSSALISGPSSPLHLINPLSLWTRLCG